MHLRKRENPSILFFTCFISLKLIADSRIKLIGKNESFKKKHMELKKYLGEHKTIKD